MSFSSRAHSVLRFNLGGAPLQAHSEGDTHTEECNKTSSVKNKPPRLGPGEYERCQPDCTKQDLRARFVGEFSDGLEDAGNYWPLTNVSNLLELNFFPRMGITSRFL